MLGTISRWKNELLGPDEAAKAAHTYQEQLAARAFARLPGAAPRRRRPGLRRPAHRGRAPLRRRRPAVLAHYQERWRYLHVDEYQDTNRAQYLWVRAARRAASQPRRGRRRRPEHLLVARRGPAQHPRVRARLPRRDGRQAGAELPLHAADPRRRARGRQSRNEGRKDKKLWTENPRGVLIERFEADREDEEAEWIARQVEALVHGRGAGGSVLARRADEGDERLYRLRGHRHHVPHQRPDPGRSRKRSCATACATSSSAASRFYQRREVKDALAYLRVLRNDRDVAAFERILNVPAAWHRRKDHRGTSAELAATARATSGRRSRRPPAAPATSPRRTRAALGGLRRASCGRLRARVGVLAAARAAGRGARGVGLPRDAHGRVAGGRGPLGQPARAARGRRALRATSSPEDALDRLLEETALVADQDAYSGTPTRSR